MWLKSQLDIKGGSKVPDWRWGPRKRREPSGWRWACALRRWRWAWICPCRTPGWPGSRHLWRPARTSSGSGRPRCSRSSARSRPARRSTKGAPPAETDASCRPPNRTAQRWWVGSTSFFWTAARLGEGGDTTNKWATCAWKLAPPKKKSWLGEKRSRWVYVQCGEKCIVKGDAGNQRAPKRIVPRFPWSFLWYWIRTQYAKPLNLSGVSVAPFRRCSVPAPWVNGLATPLRPCVPGSLLERLLSSVLTAVHARNSGSRCALPSQRLRRSGFCALACYCFWIRSRLCEKWMRLLAICAL